MSYQKLYISGKVVEYYSYERTPNAIEQRRNARRGVARDRRELSPTTTLGRRQDNTKRAKVAFGRLCASNFGTSEIAVLATLTFRTERQIEDGYLCFNLFTKRLRRRYGTSVRYIAVPEFGTKATKRLHFHVLFWGLPIQELEQERTTRNFASVWEYGFVDLVITNNDVRIGFYLSKYLAKAYSDPKMFKMKSYVASRNILRPEIHTSFSSLILSYTDLSTANLLTEKHYDTIYLGRAVYQLYNKN